MFDAQVLADSIAPCGKRLTTFQATYPRFIHCFHPDTEFLSQIGDEFPRWRSFDAIVALSAKVAQYEDGQILFVLPTASVSSTEKDLVWHRRRSFELAVSPQHRMYSLRRTTGNQWVPHVDLAEEWVGEYSGQRRILQAGEIWEKDVIQVSPAEAELVAYYIADGHRPRQGTKCAFHFRKKRKVEAVVRLLHSLSIDHSVHEYDGEVVIWFSPPDWVADCYTESGEKKYPEWMWRLGPQAYAAWKRGVLLSDGTLSTRTMNSTSSEVADQTQIIAALHKDAMNIRRYQGGLYKQTFQEKNYVSFRADKNELEVLPHNGRVVCFTVPSSLLFVRFRGFAFVSGNCEVMTHRVLSRNTASSRAIPTKKMIQKVKDNPAMPVFWGANQSGMQAQQELSGEDRDWAQRLWLDCRDAVVGYVEQMLKAGLHKQIANRPLEPWLWHTAILSGTDWNGFFFQRTHKDAQPEFQHLARLMHKAWAASRPRLLKEGDWHTPLLRRIDIEELTLRQQLRVSVARCARVSYENHLGVRSLDDDLSLFEKLCKEEELLEPQHLSPFEHVAMAMKEPVRSGNFVGFKQYRKLIERPIPDATTLGPWG